MILLRILHIPLDVLELLVVDFHGFVYDIYSYIKKTSKLLKMLARRLHKHLEKSFELKNINNAWKEGSSLNNH